MPILTGKQLYGSFFHMKTTVELPDELMRSVKIQAARENRKLKDLLAEIIARGLSERIGSVEGRRPPRPVSLPSGPLSIDDIEHDIAVGRA
jgi:hypothetical protein